MALVPRSPARSVGHCRLTDEELSGRSVRRTGEAPWAVTARAFVSACVWIWGPAGGTKSVQAINLFVFSLEASRPLLRPWRWDIYCVGPACLIS